MIRVRYFTNQVLGAADFERSSATSSIVSAWRNRWLHGWGVVGGLQVSLSQGQIVVATGLALDCAGNEIEVPGPVTWALPAAGKTAYLTLAFAERPVQPVPLSVRRPKTTQGRRTAVSTRAGSWPTRRRIPRWRTRRRADDRTLAASRMRSRSRGFSARAPGGSWTRAIGPGAPERSRETVTLTRIHIFGASGSGTSSLASALAATHGHRHLDSDDFYWLPTDPPYTQPRPVEARLSLLRPALAGSRRGCCRARCAAGETR